MLISKMNPIFIDHHKNNNKIDLKIIKKLTLKTDFMEFKTEFIDHKNRIYDSYTDFIAIMLPYSTL